MKAHSTSSGDRRRILGRSGRVRGILLVLALIATAAVVSPLADAQKVGNPGTVNFRIVTGDAKIGNREISLDRSEFAECEDGKNNDGDPDNPDEAQDLLIDFPADPQCTSPDDNSETAPGFQPKQDTTVTGTITADGVLNVPQSGIFFPQSYIYAQGSVLTFQIQPRAGVTGTLNPLTGEGQLNGLSIFVSITGVVAGQDLTSSCGIGPFTVSPLITGTTNPPLPNEPISGSPYDANTGLVTAVNNSFSVPAASGCALLGAASGPLSAAFGIPAGAGRNSLTLGFEALPKVTKGVNASNVPSVTTGNAPLTVNFNGTASSAARPIASYAWDFGNGETATGPTAFTTYTTPGTYQSKLTVTDDQGDKDESIQTITVTEPPNSPPVAAIGSSGTGGQAPYTVNFSGTGSSDPDGTIVSYLWDFGNDRTATTPTGSATYTQPGTYTVSLTVTDNRGATNTATRQIVVTGAPNIPPNAVIRTVSVAGTIPLTVNLSGGNSNDPDGTIASYAWDLGNGQTGTGASIQAIYTEAGTYTVSLTVTDNGGATATQTLEIEVSLDSNIAPGAEISADPVVGSSPLQVTFDGSDSADVDGTIASYAWNFGNGQNGTGPTPPPVTYSLPGTYTATLTVTDNKGATGTATQTITVNRPPNEVPVPNVTATPATGNAPLLVQLSSAGSTDPDGAITGYAWNFGNGTTSTSPNPSAVYNTPGVYTAQLTVTDNDGATSVQSQTITVNPANIAPVPVITSNTVTGPAPLSVSVNGAGSSDPDGSIVSYTWNFGNGQTATGPLASTTYTSPGSYLVRLTVVDNRGASRNTTITVVAGSTNVRPVAVLSALPTSGPAPLLVQLSSNGSNDPDGSIVSRSWDLGNGQTATGTATQFNYTVPGNYTVVLTVTDNRGAKTTATETIVVDPPAAPKDRVRLQLSGDVSYTFDGAINGGNLRVERDAFGIASVTGSATYSAPGNPSAGVSVNLSRFFIFNAFIGTVTVNDPVNGVSNATGNVFFGALSSPSATAARGNAAGALQSPTRNFNMAFTIDDRVA